MGQTLAAGIERGEQATEAVKDTMGEHLTPLPPQMLSYTTKGVKTEQAKKSARQAKETAEHKASHVHLFNIMLCFSSL